MLDSIQTTEMFIASKRDDVERAVERGKLLAAIGQPKPGLHARQAIAAALMRVAMVIDEGAGRRVVGTAAR